MRVSVDLCLVPLGVGVSLAPYVAVCQEVIEASGLEHQLGPDGTATAPIAPVSVITSV